MPLGTKFKYNPIPAVIQAELVAFPDSGKSTLLTQWIKGTGRKGVIIDADQRFQEVLTEDNPNDFFPLSDTAYEMLDAYEIDKRLRDEMPAIVNQTGLIAVDSFTAIIEPLIVKAQADVEHGVVKNLVAALRAKATAVRLLQNAITMWGVDTVWIYHYRESTDANRNKKVVTTITDVELARLRRNINLKMEIVIDANGTRGIKVLRARGGRTGMTIWDKSGKWIGIREAVEQAVWGGLSQAEQKELTEAIPTTFLNPTEAISWAWEFSQNSRQFFNDANHTKNAYEKLKRELQEELGDQLDAPTMYRAWIEDVLNRRDESQNVDNQNQSI